MYDYQNNTTRIEKKFAGAIRVEGEDQKKKKNIDEQFQGGGSESASERLGWGQRTRGEGGGWKDPEEDS